MRATATSIAAAGPPSRFDGRPDRGLEGETIAAALAAAGIRQCATRAAGAPRGPVLRHGRLLRLPGHGRRPAEPARLPDQGRRPAGALRARRHAAVRCAASPPRRPRSRLRRAGGRRRPGRPVGGARPRAAGAEVLVLDERPHPAASSSSRWRPRTRPAAAADRQFATAPRCAQATCAPASRILTGRTVWAAFSPQRGRRAGRRPRHALPAQALVIAPGAYERPLPCRAGRCPA